MIMHHVKKITTSMYFSVFLSYFLIITTMVLVLGYISFLKTSNVMQEKANRHNQKIIQSINKNLQDYFDSFEKITYIVYTENAQKLLNELHKSPNDVSWEYLDTKNRFFKMINTWMGTLKFNSNIMRMFIINSDSSVFEEKYFGFDQKYNLVNSPIYQKSLKNSGAISFYFAKKEDYLDYIGENISAPVLMIGRKVNNTLGNANLGVFVLVIKWDDVVKIIKNILSEETGSDYFIMDETNRILFSTGLDEKILDTVSFEDIQDNNSTMIKIKNESYLLNSYSSPSIGWRFISISSLKVINEDISSIRDFTVVLILFSLFTTIIISVIFSKSIVKPIRKFQLFAGNIEKGNLDAKIEVNDYHEFKILAETFNNMVKTLKQLIDKNYILTIKEKDAELNALHAQINPHFLYNTLNSINASALIHGVNEISDITYALSDMLRYSIESGKQLVKIEDEINNIRNYLKIQNIRYHGKLKTTLNIEQEILRFKTIRFILQPLVENALYHGLEARKDDKQIIINGFQRGSTVVLEVIDNGIGMSAEKVNLLEHMINHQDEYNNENGEGKNLIGLKNVHQRIKLVFGEEYGISIHSEENKGTRMGIILPVVK